MSDLSVSKKPALLFDFNADHNGVKCIASLKPEDQGTEHQYWFTRQMLCEVLGVKSVNTIDNHVDTLIKRKVVDNVKNLTLLKSDHGKETTLYDLTVFNYLVMRLDTDLAWEKKEKFNDILVKEETKPVEKPKQELQVPKDYSSALRLAADLWDKNIALETEKHELEISNKSLKAQNGVLSQDYKSNKDICEEIVAEGLTKYAISTLKSKVSKVLQKLSREQEYSISEQIVVVDGVERRTPFYHVDICEQIKENLREDPLYLKGVK